MLKQPDSDHKPISVSLKVGDIVQKVMDLCLTYKCFKWHLTKRDDIKQALCDLDNPCLQQFLDSMIMNCNSNQVAAYFDSYICNALEKHVKLKSYKTRSDFPQNEWYDDDCKNSRFVIKYYNEDTIKYPNAVKEYK